MRTILRDLPLIERPDGCGLLTCFVVLLVGVLFASCAHGGEQVTLIVVTDPISCTPCRILDAAFAAPATQADMRQLNIRRHVVNVQLHELPKAYKWYDKTVTIRAVPTTLICTQKDGKWFRWGQKDGSLNEPQLRAWLRQTRSEIDGYLGQLEARERK